MNQANITPEKIRTLNIHELREVARQVGVYSPTTLSKPELLSAVFECIGASRQQYEQALDVQSKGRPARKRIIDQTALVGLTNVQPQTFKDQQSFYLDDIPDYDETPTLHMSNAMQSISMYPENFAQYKPKREPIIDIQTGTVVNREGELWLVKYPSLLCETDILLTPEQILTYGLKEGDQVTYEQNFDLDSDICTIGKVINIQHK